MPDYQYAKGRIAESVQFISEELLEFESEYAIQSWQNYKDKKKVQKLMDRTDENILTALIEVCGTILTEEGIAVDSYGEALRRCSKLFDFPEDQQERLAKLAIQRNRLAHRYLNFRWQAVEMFKKERSLLEKLISLILDREEKK